MNLNLKAKPKAAIKVHDMVSQLREHARERGQTFALTKKYKQGKLAYAFFDRQTGEQVSGLLTVREAYNLIKTQ